MVIQSVVSSTRKRRCTIYPRPLFVRHPFWSGYGHFSSLRAYHWRLGTPLFISKIIYTAHIVEILQNLNSVEMERIIFISGIISILLVYAEAACWLERVNGKIFARKKQSFVYLLWVFHPTREFFTHMETSPLPVEGCNFRCMLGTYGDWALRVL